MMTMHKPFPELDQRTAPEFSDEYLALEFSLRYAADLRYTAAMGRWSRWDGNIWRTDTTLHVFDSVREICRLLAEECKQQGAAKHIASAQVVAGVERLARCDRRHAAVIEQWDGNPWLLATPGGTVDLKTGELRPARRTEYLTKSTAVPPSNNPPVRWLQFLEEITNGDQAKQDFLQRVAGYSLTGDISEHALFFFYGTGGNGKDSFLSALSGVLGDYSTTEPMTTFIVTRNEQHPTDMASLRGARLVTVGEVEGGETHWNEAKLKSLTGGSRISARFMRCDFFTFVPNFKLIIASNEKPALRNVDPAIMRRLHLIPFDVYIPDDKRDPKLGDKLQAEWPGILAWAIDGCLIWQVQGLDVPPSVRAATNEYFAAQDSLQGWLQDCCVQGGGQHDSVTRLFQSWKNWCTANEKRPGGVNSFTDKLVGKGFRRDRGTGGERQISGLKVKFWKG